MSLTRTMQRAIKRDPRDVDADYLATKTFSSNKKIAKQQMMQAMRASMHMSRKPKFTPKKYNKHVNQLMAKARFVTGLLIRATGQSGSLVNEVITGRDTYHQRIFERGTTISPLGCTP